MQLGDAETFAQSKAQAAARLPPRKERIKCVTGFDFRKSAAMVDDGDFTESSLGQIDTSGVDADFSAVGKERLPTVPQQLVQNDGELSGIGEYVGVGGDIDDDVAIR